MAKNSAGRQLDQGVQAQCRSRCIFFTISCTFWLKYDCTDFLHFIFSVITEERPCGHIDPKALEALMNISHYLITAIIFLIYFSAKVQSLIGGV